MGTARRVALNAVVIFLAISVGVYQIYLKPLLAVLGVRPARIAEAIGNKHCITIPQLQACEESILHQPTGIVYAACSTPASRAQWTPALDLLNSAGASTDDYVATYDPPSGGVTRLSRSDFNDGRGLSLHGMDVVASKTDPEVLYIYLVNHRIPLEPNSARDVGADSVIEIFSTTVGGSTMRHLHTVEDSQVIIAPNSVSGSADGKSFYFTNDHAVRVGVSRIISNILGHNKTSIGYCHVDTGCNFAITGLHSTNGIAVATNGTIYAADSLGGRIEVFERQGDNLNTFVHTDSIYAGYNIDNVALDANGHLWVAGMPSAWKSVQQIKNPSLKSPSSVFRLSKNTGRIDASRQEHVLEKVFEDDGNIMPGITTAAYDPQRRKIFMSGIASTNAVICDL